MTLGVQSGGWLEDPLALVTSPPVDSASPVLRWLFSSP